MKKSNLLFISAHLPSMQVPQAGQKIAYQTLKRYAERYNVYLLSFYNEVEKTYANSTELNFCTEIHLYGVTALSRVFSALTNISLPLRASVRASGKVRKRIAELQRTIGFEAVHFEFTAAACYLKEFGPAVQKVITEHDLTYQSVERKRNQSGGLARFFYNLEYMRQKKWELESLAMVDEIIVLNDKDRQILVEDGIPPAKIRVNPPSINPIFRQVKRDNIEKHSILFWGAMDRVENIDAVTWFIKDIFPAVLEKCRDARLYVAGANPPAGIVGKASPQVTVTGFVDDPLIYFSKCQIAVAPLRMGAGVKVKVLEYLEAGMPVIATSVGAEGIDHENLVVADRAGDFARAVLAQFAGRE